MRRDKVDLCVIGGGSAGLSVASTAAGLGLRVVLVERERLGGECLNTGCVPSKALLAAARAAHGARQAATFGIDTDVKVDFARVHQHVHEAIAAIAPHDSREHLQKLGIEVVQADAEFAAPRELRCDGRAFEAGIVVIATGSAPIIPKIDGLDRARYYTNETLFDIDQLPAHLAIVGAGPVGIEMAQAFRRLGSKVTVLDHGSALPKDDPELSQALLRQLAREGVAIREKAKIARVESGDGELFLEVEETGQKSRVQVSHLLIATGRKPRVEGLALERAGVDYNDDGIAVDEHLRTTAKGVYAGGDVVDGPHFTHVCTYHAGIIVKNALMRIPARLNYDSLPWVTYTDPELAQIGLTEKQARERHGDEVRVVRVPYAGNDRAQVERQPEGMLKLVARRNGKVLGASILGAHAGELAPLWVLAIERGLKLRHVAQMIAPYPTWAELDRSAAAEFMKPRLFNRFTRRIAPLLARV
jgi:pyruvate/2-oxoglutarate dehydrogenase complex dihydrolipoamide dehydrogenase (E3) component